MRRTFRFIIESLTAFPGRGFLALYPLQDTHPNIHISYILELTGGRFEHTLKTREIKMRKTLSMNYLRCL